MGLLRFYLAFSVLVSHIDFTSSFFINPYLSVLCFYIVSGFYMTMVINEKYSIVISPYKTFIYSRILRLAPAYYLILFLSLLFMWCVGNFPYNFSFQSFIYLISNLSLIGLDYGFLSSKFSLHDWRIIAISWTLTVEFQFYVIAPFLVTKSISKCVLFLCFLLLIRLYVVFLGEEFYQWRYFFTPAVMCFFFLGVIAYKIFNSLKINIKIYQCYFALAILIASGLLAKIYINKMLDSSEFWLFYIVFSATLPFIFF
jgi:peptidoglycan/LPS O-acetylase OafA/YrhL